MDTKYDREKNIDREHREDRTKEKTEMER